MRYTADQLEQLGPGETDWARIDTLTDEAIEAAMRDDPDWVGADDFDWSGAVLIAPERKDGIAIRVDEDVVDFFKAQGSGYERRINSVLRGFMERLKRASG